MINISLPELTWGLTHSDSWWQICSAGNLTVLDKKLVTVRLGRGLENNLCMKTPWKRGLKYCVFFRRLLVHYQPQNIRICGTEALRQAKNSHLFLQKAEEILQQTIDIITGEEEAHLSLAGALAGYREPFSGPLLLVDVGGGSTELIFAESPAGKTRVESMPLGVVRLTEKFLAASQPDLVALDSQLEETLHIACEKLALLQKEQPLFIMGCGGTATSMAALDLNLTSYNASLVHGHILQHTSIEKLWNQLIVLPADKRNALPCLGEGRGEISARRHTNISRAVKTPAAGPDEGQRHRTFGRHPAQQPFPCCCLNVFPQYFTRYI